MIRPATPDDVPEILRLVRELATYERAPDSVVATEELLTEALFPTDGTPAAWCHVAVVGAGPDEERVLAGFALWFFTFSTWVGRRSIHLEDLYVAPEHRGSGLGKALLATLAGEAVRQGCGRLEWQVLDWNSPAIGFYRSLGAQAMDEWTTFRLDWDALTALGAVGAAG